MVPRDKFLNKLCITLMVRSGYPLQIGIFNLNKII